MSQTQIQAGTSSARKWFSLVAVCFGLFMALLDVTIVNVALPTIQKDLNASISNLEWVINAYTLIFAITLVTVSRLGDIFGRKTFFILGLSVFTIGSALCAFSGDINIPGLSHIATLNISRGIQGLGASAMLPLSLAIISATFTGKQRGVAIGIWGGVSGLATAIGPLVGGVLVQKVNWQSIFSLNIPIGIIGILVSIWAIRQSKDESKEKKIDIFGLIMITIIMFCLIYGLIRVNEANMSWTSPSVLSLLIGSGVALFIFILVELRLKAPMVDPRLFRNPSFTGAAIAGFTLSGGLYALFFYLTLYLQNFLGFSALQAGLRFLPLSALALFAGPFVGRFMGKWGPKPFIVTALSLLAISVYMMTVISPSDQASDWIKLLPAFIIAGVANGMINPPISNLAVSTVEPYRVGMGAGVNNVCRQIGIAFGTAFFGAVLSSQYTKNLTDKIHALKTPVPAAVKQKIIDGLTQAGPIAGSTGLKNAGKYGAQYAHSPIFGKISEIAQTSFVDGTLVILRIAAIMLAIGAICSFFLIRKKDLKH